ncbi:MAG: hypothetical protein ACON4T_07230 [Synechococcus sp.]
MAEAPYLIALALLEQNGARALPLGGRSLPADVDLTPGGEPDAIARELALELLVRVWQRSAAGPLNQATAEGSLLVAELPMECLPDDLPALKAAWLNSGDTTAFHQGLRAMAGRVWAVSFVKFQPLMFVPLGD